jgi:D-alanyl-lipoteichoic acid acyltransferase DltB (MBOAT superfamily)
MDNHRGGRNIKTLWALILLGVAYSSLLYYQRTLTGTNGVDGIIGVLLGLYICSNPVANVLDMFFFERGAQHQFSSRWSAVLWLVLNILVLLIGWFVIFVGVTRLVGRAD